MTVLFFLCSIALAQSFSPGVSALDRTGSGTLNAVNAACSVSMQGRSAVGAQLSVGSLVGTIVAEVSFDFGTTWVSTYFDDPTTGVKVASIVIYGPTTALTETIVSVGGASDARVRVSAYTSGTAACSIRSGLASDPSLLTTGGIGIGVTTAPPSALQLGGFDALSKLYSGVAVKSEGNAPQGTEPALVVTNAEMVRIRILLEQILEQTKSTNLLLQNLKDPGRSPP